MEDDGPLPRQQRRPPPFDGSESGAWYSGNPNDKDNNDRPVDPPPPPYADWWTRADAAAAATSRVDASEGRAVLDAMYDADDDEYSLRDAMMRSVPTASPWWEVLELAATFGAAGGGVAALLAQEATFAVLVAALPLVAAGARRQREKIARELTAALLLELREEKAGLARKAQRDVAVSAAVDAAAAAAAAAVEPRVTAAIDRRGSTVAKQIDAAVVGGVCNIEKRILQVEKAVADAAASSRASAREAGSVAGMLARDVAAARTDTRSGLEALSEELRAAAETASSAAKTAATGAKGDVIEELNALSRMVRSVEEETRAARGSLIGVGSELEAIPG